MDIEQFYDADPRRRESEEVAYGHEWTDADGGRYEVMWVEDTGEVYAMFEPVEPMASDGIGDIFPQHMPTEAVTVEVLGVVADRATIDASLAGWEDAMPDLGSIAWVRERIPELNVQHTKLGRTGLTVSRLCLGTMTFGLQCDEATSFAILDHGFDAGITFLDTADVYPLGGGLDTVGRTEEIIGAWMRGGRRRDDVVLATKCFGPMGPNPWDMGNSRKHVMSAIDESLRRLGTDYVDLYQLHFFDGGTPIDETLGALDDLVRAGKVRYVGCSNFLAYQLARAVGRSEARDLVRFESVQPRYNLLFREFERELFPLCADERIGVIPYNPIAGGMLSGKHAPGAPTDGTRFTLGNASRTYQDRYWHDREFATVDALKALADAAGMSLVTLAVAWVLANPVITSPIIGASRPEQLADSLAALDVTLDADLLAQCNDLTAEYRRGDAAR